MNGIAAGLMRSRTRRRTLVGAVCSAALLGAVLSTASPARAGTVTNNGVTVTWDDATVYEPTGCSSFNFNYQNSSGAFAIEVVIKNQFGDNLGSKSVIGSPSGVLAIQVCKSSARPIVGTVVELQTTLISGGQSVKGVGTAPITFLSRTPTPAPSPSPSTTTPPSESAEGIRCINKTTFKITTFYGKKKCPKGWKRIP